MPISALQRRIGAGVLAGTTVLAAAPAAGALEVAGPEARAALDATRNVPGLHVNLDEHGGVSTALIGLTADDGAALRTFCVELHTDLDYRNPDMTEVPWDSYPDPSSPFHQNRDKIHWILQNSFPAAELTEVETAVGGDFDGGLSTEEAIAATQAAIWSFSDGAELDLDDPTPRGAGTDSDVLALYEYLTGDANTGIGEQPAPELQLDPASLSGQAGERIGPFTVETSADVVDVEAELPEGAELVDADGNPVPDQINDGAELHVDVPADAQPGEGVVRLRAEAALNVGRLFVGTHYDKKPTQSLILAQSDKTKLEVEGHVDWTEKPEEETPTEEPSQPAETPDETPPPVETPEETPSPVDTPPAAPEETPAPEQELPDTGTSPAALLVAGLALLGGAALVLRRRFTPAQD